MRALFRPGRLATAPVARNPPHEQPGQTGTSSISQPTGSAIGYRITGKLDEVQSPFQKIEIYDTTDWGKLMVIDGAGMLTTRDNFFYHEMISHPVLFTHAAPKRVVIIGGGDCGTLREVLKHPGVESAPQLRHRRAGHADVGEVLPGTVRVQWRRARRAAVRRRRGLHGRIARPAALDIVIVDSTDPVGPAEGLFNKAFYDSCFRALKDERHPGAAIRVAAGAPGPDQGNAPGNGQGWLPVVQDADLPAALLPDRLVELHDGAQGRRSHRRDGERGRGDARQFPTRPYNHEIYQKGAGDAGVHARRRSANRMNRRRASFDSRAGSADRLRAGAPGGG